jgi:hypothetical protein
MRGRVLRKGVWFLLQQSEIFEVFAEAEDGREAVRLTKETNPTF